MKKELQIGSINLTAILEGDEGQIEIVDQETGDQEIFLHINKSYFSLLFTIAKLGAFEIKENETGKRISLLTGRIQGAEEMLLNVMEVLKENQYVLAPLLPALIRQLEKEYRSLYQEVYSGDIPRELFRNE